MPLPGQIRCPTCHRSTPPAAFCTQCGTAIPDSARARPRGFDREELKDRIRGHRPGDPGFRRGAQPGGEQGASAYRPFQPEPEDELVLPGATGEEGAAPRVDNAPPDVDAPPPVVTPPPDVTPPPALTPPPAPPPPAPVVADEPTPREPQPAPWKPAPPAPPVEPFEGPSQGWAAPGEPYDAGPGGDDGYREPPRGAWDRGGPGSGSGFGPFAIGGFVLLGVLAIGVGALMAGLFSGGTALGSPSPTPLISTAPSPSLGASPSSSGAPSAPASVGASTAPSAVADEFTARTEPCAEQPASQDGCGSSGSTVSGGSVWVWVGWRKGSDADTLGVSILDDTGADVGTGSLALSTIGSNGCGASCNGWARFKFGGLDPGDYTIRVDRNGVQVAEASFTVNQP